GRRQPARDHHADFGGTGSDGQQEHAENSEREGTEIDGKPHDDSFPGRRLSGRPWEDVSARRAGRLAEAAAEFEFRRHCEERSDEAIHASALADRWTASL